MYMLLCVILSVQLCFYHLSQGSVFPFFCFCVCCQDSFQRLLSLVDLFLGLVALFFLSFFYYFLNFKKNLIIIFYFNNFILFYFILFFLSFFLPLILSHVDDRLLVLQLGVRPVHLRWESQVQDTGPPETLQLHVISNGENLPEISISTQTPSSTQRPASYSAGHPMPNNQQDRNTTPPISREAA